MLKKFSCYIIGQHGFPIQCANYLLKQGHSLLGFISSDKNIKLWAKLHHLSCFSTVAEFERNLLRERVKTGIAHAKKLGKPHGRPKTVSYQINEVKQLFVKGLSKSEIAKKLNIGCTSVRCLLRSIDYHK